MSYGDAHGKLGWYGARNYYFRVKDEMAFRQWAEELEFVAGIDYRLFNPVISTSSRTAP
jgi:hypothetical protein